MEHQLWPILQKVFICDKTRQDNVLFGVLSSPMYIDFIQIYMILGWLSSCLVSSLSFRPDYMRRQASRLVEILARTTEILASWAIPPC